MKTLDENNKFYVYGFHAGMTGQLYDPSVTWSKEDKAIYKQGFDDARSTKDKPQ